MMRTYKIWVLIVVATALGVGGTGCKKDGAEGAKTYLVDDDPGSPDLTGQTPIPDPNPCTAKGAVGAMELMLKAGDCAPPKSPVCGNGIQESGEECDGNPNCGANCKWTSGGNSGGGSGENNSVTIKTTSLPPAYQEKSYNAPLTATCKPSPCNFAVAAGTSLPNEFKIASGKLVSSKVKAPLGAHSISLVVQNKDGSKSATQMLTLTVQKHLMIRSFVEGFTGFEVVDINLDKKLDGGDFKSSAANTALDSRTFIPITKDGKLEVGPSQYNDDSGCTGVADVDQGANDCRPDIGWIVLGVNFKTSDNGTVDKDLKAATDADAAATYTWSVKGKDGKDLPGLEMGSAYSSALGKTVGYMIFIKPKMEGSYAQYYADKSFKDVKITVSDDKGNKGELTINDLIFKAPLETKAVIDAKKKASKELYDACHNLKVEDLTFDKEVYKATGEKDAYTINVNNVGDPDKALRVNNEYDGILKITGGSGKYTVSKPVQTYDETMITPEGDPTVAVTSDKATISWTPFQNYNSSNYAVTDTTTFDVSDDSSKCKQTIHVTVYRSLKYPDYSGMTIKDVKLRADFSTEWTDGDSKVKFEIMGKNANGDEVVLSQTAEESADGGDPTCFNKYFTLTPVGDHGDDSISAITYVRLGGIDDGAYDMELYFKYLRLDVQNDGTTVWYAEAPGDFWHSEYNNDNNWEYNNIGRKGDSSAFKINSVNYDSIWFYGEPPHHADEGGPMECDEWKH